jgi:hypothetical protein
MGDLTIYETDASGNQYSASCLTVVWSEGYKRVSWDLLNDETLIPTLKDILATVEPNNQGPLFLAPADRHPAPNPVVDVEDKAARDAEMALRNGGAAIKMGVGFEGVPTFEGVGDIPPVDWSR